MSGTWKSVSFCSRENKHWYARQHSSWLVGKRCVPLNSPNTKSVAWYLNDSASRRPRPERGQPNRSVTFLNIACYKYIRVLTGAVRTGTRCRVSVLGKLRTEISGFAAGLPHVLATPSGHVSWQTRLVSLPRDARPLRDTWACSIEAWRGVPA